jgi:hypothetical protein
MPMKVMMCVSVDSCCIGEIKRSIRLAVGLYAEGSSFRVVGIVSDNRWTWPRSLLCSVMFAPRRPPDSVALGIGRRLSSSLDRADSPFEVRAGVVGSGVGAGSVNDGDMVPGSLELPEGDIDGDTTLTLGLELVKDPGVLEGTLAELSGFLL